MDLLRNTNIDFMKYRKVWVAISVATILAGLVGIFFLDKLNFGVDFAGGTQLTLRFHDRPNIEELRGLVDGAGFRESVIQRFGAESANEAMIRTPIIGGSEEGSAQKVKEALNQRYNGGSAAPDLNQIGAPTLADVLAGLNPDGVTGDAAQAHYAGVAESVMKVRKNLGIFSSWDEVARAEGLSPAALAVLKGSAQLGKFAVLSVENVGPQVGKELRRSGFLAVIGALLGMLVYIWLRFELRFGVGATMASLHDVLITLGLFAWFGFEFNLTSVAAFLTLIGYSVNDTVVTFDRVRENMRRGRSHDMVRVLNTAINQTLSRTLLTGGTVILASLALLIFGGEVIRGMAFIMTVGVVVGTYSSIYIASPFALYWEQWFGARGKLRDRPAAPAARTARAKR
jgi:preprotein translocase subunit SecF